MFIAAISTFEASSFATRKLQVIDCLLSSDYVTDWTIRGSVPGRAKGRFSKSSRLAVGGAASAVGKGSSLPCGKSSLGLNLTTHLHPVPRLRICGAIILSPSPYSFMVWTGYTVP